MYRLTNNDIRQIDIDLYKRRKEIEEETGVHPIIAARRIRDHYAFASTHSGEMQLRTLAEHTRVYRSRAQIQYQELQDLRPTYVEDEELL